MPVLPPDSSAALQKLVDRLASRKTIPHVALTVEALDGSFSWSRAAGAARPDGTPMTPETPFFIASIDKTFVATATLILHERGALSIEDSITEYLPPDVTRGLHRLNNIDHTSRITLRNLLGHTSGLPDYLEDYPRNGPSLIEQLFSGDDRELTRETVILVVRDRLSPHFPPQAGNAERPRTRYSDTNYRLLTAILEAVCRKPLHEAIAEMIFRPLNLRHTWYAGSPEPPGLPDHPATLWVGDQPFHRPRLLRSLHSIYSTPADLIAFFRSLVQGGIFRNNDTYSMMQDQWNRFGIPRDRGALRSPSWPIEYGLGLMRFQVPRMLTPFWRMPPVIGHTGSTGTWLFFCEPLKIFIVGAVNQATAGPVPFRLVPNVLRILSRSA